MFAQTFSKLSAVLPKNLKYKLSGLKPLYYSILGIGQKNVTIHAQTGDFRWRIDALTSQTFILGTYELYMQRSLKPFIRPGFVIYDIGAAVGFHTLVSACATGQTGKVIAFEPHPENFKSLSRQIAANPDLPVEAYPYAISDICAQGKLDSSQGNFQGRLSPNGSIRVEMRSVDALIEKNIIPAPQVIKIDVEGHEDKVLMGMTQTLKDYAPVILCDKNDSLTLSKLIALLTPYGYSIKPGPPITAEMKTSRSNDEEK